MSEQAFEVVYEAETELDASFSETILKDAGIPVVVRSAGDARPYLGEGVKPVAQLLVPAEQSAKARSLLATYQQQVDAGAFALEDEDGEE